MYELSRVYQSRAVLTWTMDFVSSEIRKKLPTDFSDNANKTSVFVSGWIYAEGFFDSPWSSGLDLSSKQLTDVSGLDRALRLSQPSRHGDRRDHSPGCFKFKNLKFTWFFCLDRKTTKQRNDKRRDNETCSKWLIYRQDHHSGTVPVRKRSFFVSNGSFVVSSFRSPVTSKA